MIKFHILCDNYSKRRGFLAEHGLSVWIETDDGNILFDTGQTDVFSWNAETSGVDLSKVNALVISHGHYDHTGGVPYFCRLNTLAPIYMHPKAFNERFYMSDGKTQNRSIGVPWSRDVWKKLSGRINSTVKTKQINSVAVVSPMIPRGVAFEDVPHYFFVRNENDEISRDLFIDEQILVLKGNKGIYIFVGCSHVGVVNCLRYAQKLFPGEKIAGLIGGMHMESVPDIRIELTIQSFLNYRVETIIPLHCTGMIAICEMKRFLKERCHIFSVGDEIVFER
ncbi:MBL fold metallo-hydrolase [Pelotomaculum sp. PtaB.Bin117]|uniref:MBL fold metallo-hydrolase n=1 Tax=Pelotomaculum sp. PtaB.Bin117 TaxID=1811694 RepID=UPI0009CD9F40|nr:MBL fold metallo-hydrolase [Pelotomaculum sp. PtaB.Bin117]OPX86918.1 MAG: Metallo-beta-lactamase superfamily protein [Pelotomaculum sp. PtaB.Bin117]